MNLDFLNNLDGTARHNLVLHNLGTVMSAGKDTETKKYEALLNSLVDRYADYYLSHYTHMRAFAAAWPDKQIVQEVLAQLTWYQNLALLEKLKDSEIRLWYAHKTREHARFRLSRYRKKYPYFS